MQSGDRVNWSHTPRGGYGIPQQVAGVVVRLTSKRVIIQVARRVAGAWMREERSVSPEKLTPRTGHCAALGE